MYDQNIEEQQITKVTRHKSVAVCNYKCTSMEKQQQVLDILYGKKKWQNNPTATVSTPNANFDLGMNSQAMPKTELVTNVKTQPTINVNLAGINIKKPVVNIDQSLIMVSPVINLKATDLQQNQDRHIQLPLINVQLTININ